MLLLSDVILMQQPTLWFFSENKCPYLEKDAGFFIASFLRGVLALAIVVAVLEVTYRKAVDNH